MIFLNISITIEEKDTDFSFFKSFLFMNPDDLSIQIERLHTVTTYDVVPKEEIAEFEELMRKTIADIVSEASSVVFWVYVQKYVKHKTLNEMLQELPDVGQFILAMNTLAAMVLRISSSNSAISYFGTTSYSVGA